jgi:hypothetical protein
VTDHGFGWEQLREVPMLDLAPGDTWVQPAIGSTWSAGPDGRLAGWDHSWHTRPPRGRALTVLSRDGDVITIRTHEGEQKTVTIPRDRQADVLLVDQLGEQRRGWTARTNGAAPASSAGAGAMMAAGEVGSHAAALTYTAAMSAAAADTAASLESTIAAMVRRQVGTDAIGHLSAARAEATVMASALASAHEILTKHTAVGEAYAAAPDAGDKNWMSDDAGGRHRVPEPRKDTMTSAHSPAGENTERPSSGVADLLGYADGDTCHGTDQVASVAGPATVLALMDYGDGGDRWDGGRYVAVGTSPHRWNPVTNAEDVDSGQPTGYAAPHLDPAEAEAAAAHLDELADLAEAGHRPAKPTKWSRAADRLEHLLTGDADLAREKVTVIDDELPVTVRDLLELLRDKQPAARPATRRHVATTAMREAGGDAGTLWMDLVDHDGTTRVAVTGVEGDEDPAADFWQPYTAQHTPQQARELATKLRTFATGAREAARGALYLGDGDDAAYLDWSMRTPDGGRNLEIGAGADAVSFDLNPTQMRELHDALTATITADDFADAPGAYWPQENDEQYIDWSDFEYERGFSLEAGDGTRTVNLTLTMKQLQAWRDRLATELADGDTQ